MMLLIFVVAVGAAITAVVGYVAMRDRAGRGSFVDPSISRSALTQAERQTSEASMAPPRTDHAPGF